MGKHLPAIDGLRAFAVLAVVAYHARLPVPAGFVGVDVFFVISGYVITRMLLSEPQIDLLAFYARRVRRILPALVLVVAATLALSAAMLSADLQIATNRSAIAAMAMAANVWFQLHTGYFDVAADQQPLLHLWSLGVEEQFYLVWPLLLIALRRKPWVLAGLAVTSLALAEVWPAGAFYSMPARFWELAVGGLIAFLPQLRATALTGLLGLLLLAVAVLYVPQDFPGTGALLPVFGAGLCLLAVHCGASVKPLEWRPVRYVGLVSYSFYLWHWPLLAIAKGYSFDPPTLAQNLALCALAFVLASASYHFIEAPFRRTNPPKVRAIALGVTACAMLAGCAAAIPVKPTQAGTFPEIPRQCYQTHDDAPALPPASCGQGDVVLWGDSHAQAWLPYAQSLGNVRLLSRTGCPPSALPTGPRMEPSQNPWDRGDQAETRRARCAAFNALALEQAKRGRVVILATRWIGLYQGDDATQAMQSALNALSGVPKVIVMGPLPIMPHLPSRCIATGHECEMPRAEFDRLSETARVAMREAVSAHPNTVFVEPARFFCDATDCPMVRNGQSLYADKDHISVAAAQAFATQ